MPLAFSNQSFRPSRRRQLSAGAAAPDDAVKPTPEIAAVRAGKTYYVSHVEDARGSPHILLALALPDLSRGS